MRKQCRRYDTCSAPLCPLDDQSLRHGIWYPDEEICRNQAYAQLTWIKNQKRVAKKAGPVKFPKGGSKAAFHRAGSLERYFTLEMLDRNIIIRKGIEGLDPDHGEAYQLKKWLKAHPGKKVLSQEEREEIGQRLATSRG